MNFSHQLNILQNEIERLRKALDLTSNPLERAVLKTEISDLARKVGRLELKYNRHIEDQLAQNDYYRQIL